MANTQISIDDGGGRNNLPLVLIVMLLVSIAASVFGYARYSRYKSMYRNMLENNRQLSATISHLGDSCRTYRVRCADGVKRNAALATALKMSDDNIRTLEVDKSYLMRRLGIRRTELHSVTSAALATADSVQTPVYIDTLQSLHVDYDDGYLNLHNTIARGNVMSSLRYEYRDSFELYKDVHQRHFLFFKWRQRSSRYYLVPRNPKSRVLSLRVIERAE